MSLLSHFLEFRINLSSALNILQYPSFPCTELQDYSQHNQPLETEVGLSPIPALTRREALQSPSGSDTVLGYRVTNSGHQNGLRVNHLMVLSSKWAFASCWRCTVSRLPRGSLSLVKCSICGHHARSFNKSVSKRLVKLLLCGVNFCLVSLPPKIIFLHKLRN